MFWVLASIVLAPIALILIAWLVSAVMAIGLLLFIGFLALKDLLTGRGDTPFPVSGHQAAPSKDKGKPRSFLEAAGLYTVTYEDGSQKQVFGKSAAKAEIMLGGATSYKGDHEPFAKNPVSAIFDD